MNATAPAHLDSCGDARRALDLHRSVVGGGFVVSTRARVGVPQDPATSERAVFAPAGACSPEADRVAFGMLAAPGGLRLAAHDVVGASGGGPASSDLPGAATCAGAGVTHTEAALALLTAQGLQGVHASWDALGEGGTAIPALAPGDWAPAHGMLTDRFGVTWASGVTPAA